MTTLPDPGDIQVATGSPQVEEYRAAVRSLRQARKEKERSRLHRAGIYRIAKNNTPVHRQARDRTDKKYRDAVTAMVETELRLRKAEKAAEQAAPDTLERLRLSVTSYTQRLRPEYRSHGHLLHR